MATSIAAITPLWRLDVSHSRTPRFQLSGSAPYDTYTVTDTSMVAQSGAWESSATTDYGYIRGSTQKSAGLTLSTKGIPLPRRQWTMDLWIKLSGIEGLQTNPVDNLGQSNWHNLLSSKSGARKGEFGSFIVANTAQSSKVQVYSAQKWVLLPFTPELSLANRQGWHRLTIVSQTVVDPTTQAPTDEVTLYLNAALPAPTASAAADEGYRGTLRLTQDYGGIRFLSNLAFLANWDRLDQPWGSPISDIVMYDVALPESVIQQISVPSYFQPAITAVVVPGTFMSTAGDEALKISGSYLGPQNNYLDTLRQVEYGPGPDGSTFYTAKDCTVPAAAGDNTRLDCTSVAGVGFDFKFRIRFGGDRVSSPLTSNALASYRAPVLSSFSGALDGANTGGNQEIKIVGSNFGTDNAALGTIMYSTKTGDTFLPGNCRITVDHQEITCDTAQGAGRPLEWALTVAGQASTQPTTNYGVPTLGSVSRSGTARTSGGEEVVLTGTNFGPMKRMRLRLNVQFEVSPTSSAVDRTVTGAVANAEACHDQAMASEASGVTAFSYQVSTQTCVLKKLPDGVAPVEQAAALGAGWISGTLFDVGQTLYANKHDFIQRVSYGILGTEYDVTSTCRVTAASTTITCRTAAGVGQNLKWFVTIAGQQTQENVYWSYTSPAIVAIIGNTGTRGGYDVRVIGNDFGPRERMQVTWEGNARPTLHWALCPDGTSIPRPNSTEVIPCGASTYEATFQVPEGEGAKQVKIVQPGSILNQATGAVSNRESIAFTFSYTPPELFAENLKSTRYDNSTRITMLGSNFGTATNVLPQRRSTDNQPYALPGDAAAVTPYNYITVQDCVDANTPGVPDSIRATGDCTFTCNSQTATNSPCDATCASIARDAFLACSSTLDPSRSGDVAPYCACTQVWLTDYQYIGCPASSSSVTAIQSLLTTHSCPASGAGTPSTTYSSATAGSSAQELCDVYRAPSGAAQWTHNQTSCSSSKTKGWIQLHVAGQSTNPILFGLDDPNITAFTVTPGTGGEISTGGGAKATIEGKNFGGDTSLLSVYVGENGKFPACGPTAASLCCATGTPHASECYLLETCGLPNEPLCKVVFTVPPGQGLSQRVSVVKGSATSQQDGPDFAITYSPPRFRDEDGTVLGQRASDGTGVMTLAGHNFGISETWVVWTPSDPAAQPVRYLTTTPSDTDSSTGLSFTVPAGEGKGVKVQVNVGGALDGAGQLVGGRLTPTSLVFNYFAPEITLATGLSSSSTTRGGSSVTLTGTNFGLNPIVRFGQRTISLENSSHTQLQFVVPEGPLLMNNTNPVDGTAIDPNRPLTYMSSRNIPVAIEAGGQVATWATGGGATTFSYSAPTINATDGVVSTLPNGTVSTSTPTSGRTESGEAITVRINGANLGRTGTVVFGVTTVTSFLSYGHDMIEFLLPPGQGENVVVEVRMGEQIATESTSFGYDPPSLVGVSPNAGPTDACIEFESAAIYAVRQAANPLAVRNCTRKLMATITGKNLGYLEPYVEMVAAGERGQKATVRSHDHTSVTFEVPAGYGVNKGFVVFVANRASSASSGGVNGTTSFNTADARRAMWPRVSACSAQAAAAAAAS